MKTLRLNPTMIVVMAFFLLCGCAGLMSTSLPGKTTASPMLERDTLSTLMAMDRAEDKDCKARKVVNREVVSGNSQGAVEHWVLNRCGTLVRYRITYAPDPGGGTMIGWTPGEVVGKAQ